jgi:hypothetical protein
MGLLVLPKVTRLACAAQLVRPTSSTRLTAGKLFQCALGMKTNSREELCMNGGRVPLHISAWEFRWLCRKATQRFPKWEMRAVAAESISRLGIIIVTPPSTFLMYPAINWRYKTAQCSPTTIPHQRWRLCFCTESFSRKSPRTRSSRSSSNYAFIKDAPVTPRMQC